jgi:hypothetical protein
MECDPGANPETTICAALLETVAVPSEVLPSRKVTVPLALLPAGG